MDNIDISGNTVSFSHQYYCKIKTDQVNAVITENTNTIILAGQKKSPGFPVTEDALYKSVNEGLDLMILLLDQSLRKIEYSTYGGGLKQRMMDPCVNYAKGGKVIISSMCISPDFPVTMKFAEPDKT
ncbi:MAG: hypothetical protein EOM90_13060 [Alphaproteobacteria bacterium]|nr:hypothetical protein [Alphaproteobacteria bacterium]